MEYFHTVTRCIETLFPCIDVLCICYYRLSFPRIGKNGEYFSRVPCVFTFLLPFPCMLTVKPKSGMNKSGIKMYPSKAPNSFMEKIGKKSENADGSIYNNSSYYSYNNPAEIPTAPVHLVPSLIRAKVSVNASKSLYTFCSKNLLLTNVKTL